MQLKLQLRRRFILLVHTNVQLILGQRVKISNRTAEHVNVLLQKPVFVKSLAIFNFKSGYYKSFVIFLLHRAYYFDSTYKTAGLQFFWPIWGSMTEWVNGVAPTAASNAALTTDRFGNNGSELTLSVGYLQLPDGVYIVGDCTVTGWVKLNSWQQNGPRLIDLGISGSIDYVTIGLSWSANSYRPIFGTCSSSTCVNMNANSALTIGVWYHLAGTLSGSNGIFYINGVVTNSATNMPIPRNVTRTYNYIGRSNCRIPCNDPDADASFDEIKIFNYSLNQTQIMAHVNEGMSYIWKLN
jgi:hypothetical protein